MKSQEEIAKLKHDWRCDPCWDIEDTEGFEEHYDELLAYHEEQKAIWNREWEEREAALRKEAQDLGVEGLYKEILWLKERIYKLEEKVDF